MCLRDGVCSGDEGVAGMGVGGTPSWLVSAAALNELSFSAVSEESARVRSARIFPTISFEEAHIRHRRKETT